MALLESRYTIPREFCRNPQYWHSPDSEATEIEVTKFIAALVGLIQPEFVVETGTYHGHTAYAIGNQLLANGHGRLISIESNTGVYELAHQKDMPSTVTLLNMNSMDFIPDQDIDFAFFDSWQEGRHLEFMRFFEAGRLKYSSIVAFHDTAPHHQVRKYVLNLQDAGLVKLIDFHTPRGLMLGQVQ